MDDRRRADDGFVVGGYPPVRPLGQQPRFLARTRRRNFRAALPDGLAQSGVRNWTWVAHESVARSTRCARRLLRGQEWVGTAKLVWTRWRPAHRRVFLWAPELVFLPRCRAPRHA